VEGQISETEARLALDSIERRREQVAAAVDVPSWYWLVLAGGWVGLGVLAQFGPAWAAAAGMLAFGTGHAVVAPHLLSGRRPSTQVRIRAGLVGHRLAVVVVGFLVVMTGATVGLALILNADGTRHPAVVAGAGIAAVVLLGGPAVVRRLRRQGRLGRA
jgi:hypothetical protein